MRRVVITMFCLAVSVGLALPWELETTERFSVPDLRPLSVGEVGTGEPWADVTAGRVRPTALAQGDFDGDGVPDLVVGYAGETGSFVTLQRGNVDSIFPHSVAARQRRAEGKFTDEPFLTPAAVFDAPVPPDFLGVGDYDNDGNLDVIIGSQDGNSLQLLAGDGEGGLETTEVIELPGRLTAMVTGEINRRDGLADLVAGVRTADGFQLVVFEGPDGALRSEAEIVAISSEPTALLLARLGDDPWLDLIAAAGRELVIVSGRDRKLILGQEQQAEVQKPVVEQIVMPEEIESLAWGDFVSESVRRPELALLLKDGTIRLLNQPGDTIGEFEILGPQTGETASVLLPVHLSGSPTEDLAILDGRDNRLLVLAGMTYDDGVAVLTETGAIASLVLAQPPVAALPMRLNPDALTDLVLLQSNVGAPRLMQTETLATITVNTDLDNATSGDGLCSLREAIFNANLDSDTTGGDCVAGAGADSIGFNIGGGGTTATIALTSVLPLIAAPVTIDGATQGCASPPCVALDGSGAGIVLAGLYLAAGPSSVRGLVIQQMLGSGTLNDGFGIYVGASSNIIEGNYIGTGFSGSADLGNDGAGVRVADGWNNIIGGTAPGAGNLLSGGGPGVDLRAGTGVSYNQVLGNFIGTDASGTIALGSDSSGIVIRSGNHTIGGTSAGARNLISANAGNGIIFLSTAWGNLVLGNYVGTDVSGTLAIANSGAGVKLVGASNNIVGGTGPGAGNLISGNGGNGVFLDGAETVGNVFLGNFIGTDYSGTTALGNGTYGMQFNAASNNVIGGAAPGAGNTISANLYAGVYLLNGATGNELLGNVIGTDVDGTSALGNGWSGVLCHEGAWNNVVGGVAPGAGNLISANGLQGVYLAGPTVTDNQVLGNRIGTDITGTAPLGNVLAGVRIYAGSNNTVGGAGPGAGNLLSANGASGVDLISADGNRILGNRIGTDLSGTQALGNELHGVYVKQDSENNIVGGIAPGESNLISGNLQDGVALEGAGTIGNELCGNFIGTDMTGTQALGNGWNGVELQQTGNNTIGCPADGATNVISASSTYNGIHMNEVTDVTVRGNFIGTDVTGTVDLGNAGVGIRIVASTNVTIGGPDPGEGNLVAGNGLYGIDLDATSRSLVSGNIIGLQIDGVSPLGNYLHGVVARNGASDNTIGGTGVTPGRCDGPCNRIGFVLDATSHGVCISGAGAYNSILGNSLFSCGGLGIELGDDGVTPNDLTDPDIGANNLQNFPELSLAEATPSGLTVSGSLNSRPGRQYRLEFYASPYCDDSGHGEGATYLGFHNVTTDGNGDANFSVPTLAGVSNGNAITATATSVIFGSLRDTSEFSGCLEANCLTLATFAQTVTAPDTWTLAWASPDHVQYVKGPLAGVGSYTVTGTGDLPDATSLDISMDLTGPGGGFYYLIRPLACGSWQTDTGAEPVRDTTLP